MFTGIVEEIGKISRIIPIEGGISIKIEASKILEDILVNDSICIDGVCLTVVKAESSAFWIEAVGATIDKTTFSEIKESSLVNLERSVRLNDRLGGHLVQGHINGVGSISGIEKLGENYLFKIIIPKELEKYLIKEGSIAINGISLTIADLENNEISISIIPHTWQNTSLKYKQVLDKVNVEIDILAKYVEKLLTNKVDIPATNISEKWLKELGY
jgi:riboflavin synthase